MRRLRLLGPARVDRIPKAQKNAAESAEHRRTASAEPRFRSRRTVALLGYLVAERRSIARDALAALFWPDEAASKGRTNLRREIHNLGQILPDCWELDHQAVTFVPSSDVTIDLYTLQQLEAEERWQEAAELLGGELLEGLSLDRNLEFENWLLGERERWRGRTVAILTRVIEGHTRRGHYADALRHTRRLLQLAPWNEDAHRQGMRLLTWTGRRGAALRQYEACGRALWEELGVEPTVETTALYRQIRSGELDLPPQLPTFLTEEGARSDLDRPRFVARERELAQLDAFLARALAGHGRVCFVTGGPGSGKTALMDAFALRAMEAHPDLLVVSGNCSAYSDVGDPFLPFRDAMAMLSGDVEARWDSGAITRDHAQRLWAALPLVIRALLDHGPRLLDVLVPGAALLSRAALAEQAGAPWLTRLRAQVHHPVAMSREAEQSDLFQQVASVLRTVVQEHPLLLILDDVQWADVASVSLLFYLGRRLAGADNRFLIVCAYRPEEVAVDRAGERHPLARALNEFKRIYGDVWVDLEQADRMKGRRFIDALLDTEPHRLAERFRAALFQRTEGHPLFTIELLRAMQERGDLIQDEEGCWIEGPALDWEAVPARVEAVIAERIDRLDPELQEILTVASVEGEVFTAQVVARVQATEERSLLHRLSQDLERRHRLVSEREEVQAGRRRLSRYRFRHVLFQQHAYSRLSPGERRLLHGDVAAALESLYDGQLDEMAVQMAHHYREAGDYGRAFRHLTLAAERASRLYASAEAVTHYTRAIEVAEKVSPDAVSLAKLYRGRGLASERVGDFDRARADHDAVLELARADGERRVEWRALLDLGKLWASRDYHRALGYLESALAFARRMDDPVALADSLNWMGNWYANAEDSRAAVAHHQEALEIAEELGDRQELANTLDLLGIAHLLGGNLTASVPVYDRVIALSRELDDRPCLVSGLIGRGLAVSGLLMGASVPAIAPSDALRDLGEAIRIAREIGSATDEAWAHWALGELHTVRGRFGPAMTVLKSGLCIASRVGSREHELANRSALGLLYVELLASEPAVCELKRTLAQAHKLRSQVWIHLIAGALAGAYILHDDLTGAKACLETVLSAETPMDTMGKRYCWTRRAELALAQGDPVPALDIVERLIASAPGMSPGRVISFLWKLKSEALAGMGRREEARSLLQAAAENAEAAGERFLLWRLHGSLGRLYCTMGRPSEAENEFATARELVAELADTVPDGDLRDNLLQRAHDQLTPLP
ncbi:MAG: tetratricopeptide repeat protein [Anaerolineae bacterium]|nr:tetratricopeptide repeat protein [Anaerolineae bacterium]